MNKGLGLQKLNGVGPPAGPVVLVIADGVGIGESGKSNAVDQADTPTLDQLWSGRLFRTLKAHGTHVGLPSDDDIGNSEVGHNALGAGRIFDQGAKLINQAIKSGTVFDNAVWSELLKRSHSGGTLHFLGLASDGVVHSDLAHLEALCHRAVADGVSRIRIHALLDGRDTPERSAGKYISRVQAMCDELKSTGDVQIASGGGRMKITMDRYEADWSMVERGYKTHVKGEARQFLSASEAIDILYSESDRGDQYLEPFAVYDREGGYVGEICDGDSVVLFNFRGDRAIEISRALEAEEFREFDRGDHPDILFAGMLQYDGDMSVPANYLVDPPVINNTLSEYLCNTGLRSFAVSETQKFGHVTYFWNGNNSGYFDENLETYFEIQSENIEFDQAPAMKAADITEVTIGLIESGNFEFGRINYPNGDMVGHTGDLQATITAVEEIDRQLARLLAAVEEAGGTLVFTADHGNADVMLATNEVGQAVPVTSHTINPVPFAIRTFDAASSIEMSDLSDAGLGHVAATICNLLGYEPPEGYLPSLIEI